MKVTKRIEGVAQSTEVREATGMSQGGHRRPQGGHMKLTQMILFHNPINLR